MNWTLIQCLLIQASPREYDIDVNWLISFSRKLQCSAYSASPFDRGRWAYAAPITFSPLLVLLLLTPIQDGSTVDTHLWSWCGAETKIPTFINKGSNLSHNQHRLCLLMTHFASCVNGHSNFNARVYPFRCCGQLRTPKIQPIKSLGSKFLVFDLMKTVHVKVCILVSADARIFGFWSHSHFLAKRTPCPPKSVSLKSCTGLVAWHSWPQQRGYIKSQTSVFPLSPLNLLHRIFDLLEFNHNVLHIIPSNSQKWPCLLSSSLTNSRRQSKPSLLGCHELWWGMVSWIRITFKIIHSNVSLGKISWGHVTKRQSTTS